MLEFTIAELSLMIEPKEVPHYLTVFEVRAQSAAQAMQSLRKATDQLKPTGPAAEFDPVDSAILYLKIGDVARK